MNARDLEVEAEARLKVLLREKLTPIMHEIGAHVPDGWHYGIVLSPGTHKMAVVMTTDRDALVEPVRRWADYVEQDRARG